MTTTRTDKEVLRLKVASLCTNMETRELPQIDGQLGEILDEAHIHKKAGYMAALRDVLELLK